MARRDALGVWRGRESWILCGRGLPFGSRTAGTGSVFAAAWDGERAYSRSVGEKCKSERRYNDAEGFRGDRKAEGAGRSLRRRFSGVRLDSVALFAHLLQEGFDRHLKLVSEQIDECVFGSGDLGCGSLGRSQAIVGQWRFQSVGFDLKLGRFISVGAQSRDHAENLIALLGRGLEELHSHPEFRMRDQYDASGADFEVGGLDFKDDTRAPREG